MQYAVTGIRLNSRKTYYIYRQDNPMPNHELVHLGLLDSFKLKFLKQAVD